MERPVTSNLKILNFMWFVSGTKWFCTVTRCRYGILSFTDNEWWSFLLPYRKHKMGVSRGQKQEDVDPPWFPTGLCTHTCACTHVSVCVSFCRFLVYVSLSLCVSLCLSSLHVSICLCVSLSLCLSVSPSLVSLPFSLLYTYYLVLLCHDV